MAYRLQTCGLAAFRIQRTFELAQLWQVLDILAILAQEGLLDGSSTRSLKSFLKRAINEVIYIQVRDVK